MSGVQLGVEGSLGTQGSEGHIGGIRQHWGLLGGVGGVRGHQGV